uniref:Transmembrane protein n=1 Tax=Fagus sylvatica TaxID=28930 RepID=A0A2N9GML0_FAGSY
MDMERLEKRKDKLTKAIAEQDKFLNDIQSSAFSVANCYFVFQGVILTIVCNGAQNLKPSNRWFLLSLSILAVLVNLFALIQIGIKYIDTKVSRRMFKSKLDGLTLKEGIPSDEKDKQLTKEINKIKHDHYLYLAIYIIIFLGFAAVVLVGCWKFLGNQNE